MAGLLKNPSSLPSILQEVPVYGYFGFLYIRHLSLHLSLVPSRHLSRHIDRWKAL